MARARLLKPGFFANEALTEVPPMGRLLFAGLWTLADREGRMHDRPKWIKGALFPYENVAIERLLDELTKRHFIVRYSDEEGHYIQVVNFLRHQTPHHREPPSTIPEPKESLGLAQGEPKARPDIVGTSPSDPVMDPVTEAETVAETVAQGSAPHALRSVEFHPTNAPPVPDEDGFLGEYRRHYEQATGRTVKGTYAVAALQVEREYGFEACMQVAPLMGWEKSPKYYVGALEDLRNGIDTPPGKPESRNSEAPGGTVSGGNPYPRGYAAPVLVGIGGTEHGEEGLDSPAPEGGLA